MIMSSHQKTIENIIEPKELYLMWKPDDKTERFKVGMLQKNSFCYDIDEVQRAKEKGFDRFSLFQIGKTYSNPMPIFMSRCPPKKRTDYDKYLRAFALPTDETIEDFTLLGYTGAYLTSDNFHLMNPFTDVPPPFQFTMQVSRFHISECAGINRENLIGKNLTIEKEPDNVSDEYALKLLLDGKEFGYIQRIQNRCFHDWLQKKWQIEITIFHVNGSSERPDAYVFVSVTQ